MDDFDTFDPALFGPWAETPVYGDGMKMHDAALADEVRHVLLEVKSAELPADPSEELRRLLNDMTVEMRDQFSTFRRMRSGAEAALESGDETARKLARADVKAATDAMSLIVRTLEKIDGLQRQLAHDREIEAERAADEGGYEEAKARFKRMIEETANDQALRLYEAWKRDGPPAAVLETIECGAAEPTHDQAEGGEDRGRRGREGGIHLQTSQPDDEGNCRHA